MRRRRRLLSSETSTKDLWASFADVTATMTLILFVLVLLAYVRNLISGKRIDAYQQEIAVSERKLRFLEEDLRKTSAEIEAGQRELRISGLKLDQQREIIAESNRELGNLRSRLQGIAVLRVEVLEKVKRSIETELGPTSKSGAPLVTVSDTGNIVINESLVFEFNSYAIKEDGKPLLDTLARALGNLLGDAELLSNIDTVLVQGHSDERGAEAFNRDLSAKRANAVLGYLFQANPVLERDYGAYFASAAYSEFRPIARGQSEAAYQQNRRIELSLVLKDENVRKVIDDYMQGAAGELPPPTNAAPPAGSAPVTPPLPPTR